MIHVAITDDHPIVIDGMINALQGQDDISISGTYRNAAELFKGLRSQPADVLMLDLQLPDRNGSELVPLLLQQYPDLHILIFSSMESIPYVREMMQQGCKGYIPKSSGSQAVLLQAIRQVAAGNIYLDDGIKGHLLQEMLHTRRRAATIAPRITQREKEVLQQIATGLTNQQIADKLFISLRTVETHRYNLLQKLNIRNTVGLLRVAQEMGLLDH